MNELQPIPLWHLYFLCRHQRRFAWNTVVSSVMEVAIWSLEQEHFRFKISTFLSQDAADQTTMELGRRGSSLYSWQQGTFLLCSYC